MAKVKNKKTRRNNERKKNNKFHEKDRTYKKEQKKNENMKMAAKKSVLKTNRSFLYNEMILD